MLHRLLLILTLCSAAFGGEELFQIVDPPRDDFGAGTISYPSGWERGELDLLHFKAERANKGTWFEVRFRNRVRSPETVTSKLGNVPLSNLLKHDFYTINVDVYIDTDGQPGSGLLTTLPGRKIQIAEDTAWEKAVMLTPRPLLASEWMKDHLAGEARDAFEKEHHTTARRRDFKDEAAALVDQHYFFSDKIQVRGNKIRFFVPDSFLGGPAQADWHYTVLVTGADPEQRMEVEMLKNKNSGLFMMPFARGRDFEAFHKDFDSHIDQPPVVDVLLPTVELQKQLLGNFDPLTGQLATIAGVSARDVAEYKAPALVERKQPTREDMSRAIMQTLLPKPKKVEVEETVESTPTVNTEPLHAAPARKTPPPPPVSAPAPAKADLPQPKLVQPEVVVQAKPLPQAAEDKDDQPVVADPAGEPESPKADRSVAERLRELEQLYKEKLVSKDEYQRLRKKILADL